MYGHHTWQTWPSGHVATWGHVTNKKRYVSTSTRAMTGKIDKVEVYSKGPPSIESFNALITWPSYHVADGKRHISTLVPIPMATKLDRVVGFNAGLLSSKSHNLLITWSYKVTWQIRNVINLLARDLSLSNLTERWLMIKQLNQSTIATRNSMYLFFFQKKKKKRRSSLHAWLFNIRILDVCFYIHDQKTSSKYQSISFLFLWHVWNH